jgi:membrane protein YdbS with pleckstrin-like domain
MGYPEKLLADDEQVVQHLHPHWITLAPATLWFVVLCALVGVGIPLLPDNSAHQPLLIAIVVIALILVCWLTVQPWLRWRTTHYVFTTHRVMIRRGILHHIGRDISLQRISDVAFRQSLWDRIVRAGTLTIESAGEQGQETLRNLPRADQMQQTLNRLIEQDHDRRARVAHTPLPGYVAPHYDSPDQGPYGQPGSYYGQPGYSPDPRQGHQPPPYGQPPGYGPPGYPQPDYGGYPPPGDPSTRS